MDLNNHRRWAMAWVGLLSLPLLTGGCAVVSATAGAAIAVTGAVASTAVSAVGTVVSVTGKAVGAAIDSDRESK